MHVDGAGLAAHTQFLDAAVAVLVYQALDLGLWCRRRRRFAFGGLCRGRAGKPRGGYPKNVAQQRGESGGRG